MSRWSVYSCRRRGQVRSVLVALFVGVTIAGCTATGTTQTKGVTSESQRNSQENGFTVRDETKIGSDAQADFNAALEALNNADLEKGIALLLEVTKRSPNAVAPYINLAIAYGSISKYDLAEENLKKALLLKPDHPIANNEYGMVYRKTGRFSEARAQYEKVVAKYPEFLPARKNLGILCDLYLKDPECALSQYEFYSAANPDDKQAALWVADLRRRLGK